MTNFTGTMTGKENPVTPVIDQVTVAIDCAILRFTENELSILLTRNSPDTTGQWSLVNGFLHKSETIDAAAKRIAGVPAMKGVSFEELSYIASFPPNTTNRVMTISYMVLISNPDEIPEQASNQKIWFPLNECPHLSECQNELVLKIRKRLRERAQNLPIVHELLPGKFTLTQLFSLNQSICSRPLDRRNFRNKILSLNLLQRLEEKEKRESKKGAFYYMLDPTKLVGAR